MEIKAKEIRLVDIDKIIPRNHKYNKLKFDNLKKTMIGKRFGRLLWPKKGYFDEQN